MRCGLITPLIAASCLSTSTQAPIKITAGALNPA
jgi:hypothetical protein